MNQAERKRQRYATDSAYRAQVRAYVREWKRERYATDSDFRERTKQKALAYGATPAVRERDRIRKATRKAAAVAEYQPDLFDDPRKRAACEVCGESGKPVEAHHRDYAFPLSIEWVCRRCHGMRHWRY